MKRVVIDTNILVSATISPEGNPAKILDLVSDKQVELYYSEGILDEYKRVLAYKKLNIAFQNQQSIIDTIKEIGNLVNPTESTVSFTDESDRIFYDVAKAINEAVLVTGNIKHYPDEPFVMLPADYLNKFNEN